MITPTRCTTVGKIVDSKTRLTVLESPMIRYQTTGRVQCYTNWMILWLDDEIGRYYRALCPKHFYVNLPMNKTHISVVRKFELPDKTNWLSFDGLQLTIEYEPIVCWDNTYYWLNAFSPEIVKIREALSLSQYLGNYTCQHITIGNTKN